MPHARRLFIATAAAFLCLYSSARSAVVYWDINGATGGAGGSAPAGTWDGINAFWNTVPDGTGAVAAWDNLASPFNTAVFAAGGDATQAYTVTVSGTQNIGGLVFEEGTVTLTGGTLQFSTTGVSMDVTANLTATIASVLNGGATATLTKTGGGTLVLSGANTYAGQTIINAGILSISQDANLGTAPGSPVADSITFGGGTLQITGTLNPTINANRGITIGSGLTGTLQVVNSANTVTYGGLITGIAGTTFKKTGAGTLDLLGNSSASLLGLFQVDGGTVRLSGSGALTGTSGVTIGNRATLTLDNVTTNLADRTAGAFTSNGGTINFIANAAATTETIGALTLNAGALTINSTAGAGGSTFTIPSLTRSVAGGTLYLTGTGLGGGTNQIVLTTAPALTNSILKYAVVNNGTVTRFATHGGDGTSLAPLTTGYTAAETGWTGATINALPTADVTLTANRIAYSLTLDAGIDILAPTADRSLTLSGAVLQTGGVSVVAQGGGTLDNILAWGTNEAIFHILGSLQLDRGNATATLTGTGGFTKSGAGTLILNGVSTLTNAVAGSGFNINEGVLELRTASALMATATGSQVINMNGALLRLSNDAGTTFNGSLSINADTTIQVDRVTAAATATTHTIGGTGGGALTLTAGRTLSIVSNDITAGTAYGLTFIGAATLGGNATIDVANNGAGLGTVTLASITGAFTLTKLGGGDLVLSGITTGFSGPVDIQAGRVGWSNASGIITESSLLYGAGGIIKSGAGTVNLTGNNTFTGTVTVTGGTLGFSTLSENGDAIALGGGVLSFIGSTNLTTNRVINVSAASTLNAGGTGGAAITYAGAITTTGNTLTLTGTAAGNAGTISGGVTQTGVAADLAVNSGTWTLSGAMSTFADDVIVTGSTAVLNLNTTGVLAYTAGTSNGLYARTGANINLGAHDVTGVANSGGNDFFFLGDTGLGTLNMGVFNATTLRLDLGDDDVAGDTANITGSGTLTVTTDFNLYSGSISANLAGAAAVQKFGVGDVTLSGDNSGLTTAASSTEVNGGNLILDYTTNNATKLSATNNLDMRGGILTINGNASADTSQTVLSLILTTGGWNTIDVNRGGTQSATLNLGAITRGVQVGTIRFELPVSGAITTTTGNLGSTGALGGWATVTDATGTWFARNDGSNNIVAVAATTKNNVSTWAAGDHITDDTTGFTGILGSTTGINTLRFNAGGPSTVTIGDGLALGINTGGILQTSSVTAGTSLITGGRLVSGAGSELIFTSDSATQTLEVASAITGSQLVTKTGLGTLRLSGNNYYSGGTRLLSGTLQVSGGKAIGDNSTITFGTATGATQNSVLELLSNETVGVIVGGTNANQVTTELRLNGNTLTMNQTGSGVFSGLITGNASSSIIKNGASFFQLQTGSNTFAGTITVNGGAFYLSASTQLLNVPTFTINKGGALVIDGNTTTTSSARIGDSAAIILNSADGSLNGEIRPSGLVVRRDQGTGYTETVGVLTLNSGASYAKADATVASAVAAIVTDDIVRANGATFDVRGTNLSATANQRGQLRIGTAANQTAFIAAMVGGGSTTLGTKNISIVPWAIAEEYTGGLGDANMGNSLATYVSGGGFRALNLTTEYNTYTASAIATENIRESLAADLTGLSGKTINALVVNNSNTTANTINFTGSGAGQTLAVTSGTMLFTATGAVTGTPAMGITLGGFDAGITVGSTNEYVIFVQNPTAAAAGGLVTATINSSLTSTADLTKSGRGTLILTSANTAGGGARKTTINEGVLQIADLDNIGGNAGNLVFAGGTLRLGAGFTDDLSTRTISFLQGGGTIDTNSIDLILANSVGSGVGGFTKTGLGNLTLNAAATYTGSTTVSGGILTLGTSGAIGNGALTVSGGATLAMGANNATVAGLTMSNAANVISGTGTLTVTEDAIVNRGTIAPLLAGSMNLIKQTTGQTVTLSNTANSFTGFTHVQNGTLSIASIANAGVASSLGAATGDNAAIRLGNATTTGILTYTGGTASTDRLIVLAGTTGGGTIGNDGTGALTLAGNITGIDYGAKTLTLQGATTSFTNVVSGIISDGLGTLSLTKAEAGIWYLTSANTYSGNTNINLGTLMAGNNLAFGTSIINLNGGTLQGDGTARTFANTLLLSANSTIAGASDLTFNGNFSQTGADRTLTVSNTGLTNFNGAFALDRAATNGVVTINAGTGAVVNISNLQDGAGTGTGSLTKSGVGILNVSNAFSIAGNFAANGGTTNFTTAGAITIAGNFTVGRNTTSTLNYNTPGGSLSVGSGSANVVEIGFASSATSVGTLNLSGLQQFTANVGTFSIAGSTNGLANADVILATNNTITASTAFVFGNSNNTGLTGSNTLQFGSGTNIVTTPLFQVAVGKASQGGNTLTIASGGTLTLNNGAGIGSDLHVGVNYATGTGTFPVGVMDLTGGTFIATLDDLIIGQKTSGGTIGTGTGTLTIGTNAGNAVTANTVTIGFMSGGSGAPGLSSGTLNFGGGTFSAAGDVLMGSFANLGSVFGKLNITGGTFTIGGNITKTASTFSTSVLIVDGASTVLDMTSGTINTSQLVFRGGAINNIAAGGVTLDANATTNTGSGNVGDALVLRDVTLNAAVTLTGASGGAVHYENANGGTGGTVNGVVAMGTVNRTFNVEDSAAATSDLTLNGDLTGSGGFTKTGAGALRFTGATAQSYTGATNIEDGRLILDGGADNRIASTNAVTLGAGTTSGVLQLGSAAGKSDLTLVSLAIAGTGTANAIVGGNTSFSTLTLSPASDTVFAGRIGGAGTNENRLNVIKTGASVLTLSGANNVSGAISVTGGVLNGGFGTVGTSITVAGGAALNFIDSSAVSRTLGTGSVLSLGTGSSLGFELGTTVDQLLGGASSTASVTGLVNIDLFAIGTITSGTYTLISMGGGGLTSGGGSYAINSAPGGFGFTLNSTDTLLQLIIAAINVPTMYWRGGLDNSWSSLSAGNTNWTTDLGGTTNAQATPAAATDVIFSATSAPLTGTAITTTLDGSFTVKTLTFTANPVGVTSVSIAPGSPGTSTLTITPASSTTGIEVQDNAGSIDISAAVVLGADQTWTISDTVASLLVSGNTSGAFSLTKAGAGVLTLSGASSYINTIIAAGTLQIGNGGLTGTLGSGTVLNNASLRFNYGAGANVTVNNIISGTGAVTKIGAGTVALGGANTYTGKTTVTGGVVQIASETALGGNPGVFTADQLTLDGGTLQTTATMDIDDANRGITLGTNGGVFNVNASTTLTVSSTLGGTGGLTKSGTGTLKFVTDQILAAATNHLTFGATNGAGASGALDLSTASATFGGNLVVQTNTATANTITIGSGESLTVNGNVTVGANPGVTSATNLTVTGAGTLNIVKAGGVVQIGGSTGGLHNNATANFSGLNSLQMNLGAAGILRIGDVSATNTGSTGISTMILAVNNNITAGTISVGDGGRDAQMVLRLGSGTNVINTNTLNVGNAFRSGGRLDFFTGTGTATVRAFDGTSRAVMNVGVGGSGTGTNAVNLVDFTGHSVDLKLTTLTITDQARMGTGTVTTTFSFDTGILDATTINISRRTTTTAATGAITTTVNFNGGTVIVGTGGITLLTQDSNTGNSGGLNSTLNIAGGTVTVDGNIVQAGAGTAAHSGTLNLAGGTLDMLNHNIGGAGVAAIDTLIFASGTLKNVAEINNGADFNKTTGGTLILEGTNTYTGVTNVNAGTLQVGSGSTSGTLGTNAALTIASGATLRTNRSNTITLSQAITGLGSLDVSNTATGITVLSGNSNTYAGGTTVTSGTLLANNVSGSATGTGAVNVAAAGTLGGFGAITTTGLTVASGGTLKPGDASVANGIGTLTVTGSSALSTTGGSVLDLQITHTNGTSTSAAANLNPDGTLNWGVILGASTVAGSSDLLDFVGTLTVNTTGFTTVNLSAANLGTFEKGMAWDLLDWLSISSTNASNYSYNFGALDLELASLGLSLDTTHFSTDGYVAVAGVVPEPGRALLLLVAMASIGLRRRRAVRG